MKPWHQFKVDHPDGYYEKEYKDYNYIVFQHPSLGHLNGYIELKEEDYNIDVESIEVHGVSHIKAHFLVIKRNLM